MKLNFKFILVTLMVMLTTGCKLGAVAMHDRFIYFEVHEGTSPHEHAFNTHVFEFLLNKEVGAHGRNIFMGVGDGLIDLPSCKAEKGCFRIHRAAKVALVLPSDHPSAKSARDYNNFQDDMIRAGFLVTSINYQDKYIGMTGGTGHYALVEGDNVGGEQGYDKTKYPIWQALWISNRFYYGGVQGAMCQNADNIDASFYYGDKCDGRHWNGQRLTGEEL